MKKSTAGNVFGIIAGVAIATVSAIFLTKKEKANDEVCNDNNCIEGECTEVDDSEESTEE